jgi:hypothetical protein
MLVKIMLKSVVHHLAYKKCMQDGEVVWNGNIKTLTTFGNQIYDLIILFAVNFHLIIGMVFYNV